MHGVASLLKARLVLMIGGRTSETRTCSGIVIYPTSNASYSRRLIILPRQVQVAPASSAKPRFRGSRAQNSLTFLVGGKGTGSPVGLPPISARPDGSPGPHPARGRHDLPRPARPKGPGFRRIE